jgi:hypothetical protein
MTKAAVVGIIHDEAADDEEDIDATGTHHHDLGRDTVFEERPRFLESMMANNQERRHRPQNLQAYEVILST